MKTQPAPSPGYHRTNLSSQTRSAAFVALIALIGIPLFSSSSASSTSENSPSLPIPRSVSDKSAAFNSNIFGSSLNVGKQPALLPFSPALAETIATFAADCTTPRTEFILGETVCAKTDGVTETDRFVNWCVACPTIDYGGAGVTDITTNPQTFLYTPTVTGTWKATIADPSDSSIIPADFTVINQTAPIATYAADCTTPKTLFSLGETVCARAQGFFPAFNRRFAWQDPAGFIRNYTAITNDPQTNSFTLPSSETEVIDIFVVDNRGTWKVNVVSGRGSALASAPFSVQGATPQADLSIGKGVNGDPPDAGTNFSYSISITNFGPNGAANVVLTDPEPANATFVSPVVQTSGPMFSCNTSNPVVCTRVAGLAVGESATFEITYTAGASGSTVTNVASVSSDTAELNNSDNTASSGRVTIGGGGGTPPTCTLDCPNDITTAINTTGGANVTFASPATFGDCGTVTTNHASGSFFPIGTTTVTSTSSTGGGSCTFNVTVINVPNPTITCPANQTVQAPSGQSEATVSVGTPTASAGTTISSERSDERAVNEQYPVGTTFITWTATDNFDRMANCTQTIIVTSLDAPTITCPSDKTFTATSGECTFTATAGQIGTPTTTGPGVTVTSERSDGEALTAAYPAGQTFITWTATNSVGTASCTQKITVQATDNTPPTLQVPADVNATTDTCSALLDDELGVATAEDNCTASVNITRTGVPRVACPIPGNPGRTCESFVFPTGTTNVTYTATDAAGNTTIGTQSVTVLESPAIPPTITAPANASYQCASEVPAANPNQATASDNCSVTVTVAQTDNGGAGTTTNPLVITRTFTAKDPSNNMASAVQTITVIDNTPPTITCPADILNMHTDPGICAAAVNPGSATASDNCSSPTIIGVRSDAQPLNALYPKGATTVTWTATDAAGNHSSCVQTITVIDVELPTITCQANIIADFDASVNGAVVTYTPPVGTDNCPGATTAQTAGLASGSTFPVGTTTNTFTVTDASNNTAQCSFKVTVALTSIIGLDSVSITGNALVDSYDSTGGYPATKGSQANILSNGTVTDAGSSKVFGNVRSTRVGVVVSGTSQVTGNATAGTTVTKGASAIIGGTITNNLLGAVMTLPPVPACGPPYSPNSGISGTYSYNASTGDLTLSGINNATLANGNYCFHNVTLTNSGQLRVNGPVTVKLTGTLNASGATRLTNATAIPANLRILSSYSGSNGVIFSNGTSVYLLLYAPNTSVADTGAAPLFGTVVGKSVTLSNSGMIHYDTKLKNIWPDIWTLIGP